MRKNLVLSLVMSIALVGCVTTETQKNEIPEDIKLKSHKIGEQMLTAVMKKDYKAFSQFFPQETKERFSEQNFEASMKNLGETLGDVEKFTFLTELEGPVLTAYVWKIDCAHTIIRDNKKVRMVRQGLFRIVTGKGQRGETILVSFNFL